MSVRKIQIGQLWKKEDTGETFLVTRVYNEALSTFVVLRKSGAENEDLVRIKVGRNPQGQTIPGFSQTRCERCFFVAGSRTGFCEPSVLMRSD